MVAVLVLEASVERRGSSNLPIGTKFGNDGMVVVVGLKLTVLVAWGFKSPFPNNLVRVRMDEDTVLKTAGCKKLCRFDSCSYRKLEN